MDEQDRKEAYDALVPHFASSFLEAPKGEGWRGLPMTYVITQKDIAIFPIIQGGIVTSLNTDVVVKWIDASHSPFLSQPKAIADWIREAAGEVL